MDCPECGVQNPDEIVVCQSCGAALLLVSQEAAREWQPEIVWEASAQDAEPQEVTPQRAAGGGYVPRVPNHLVWAICSLVFFLPCGIPAVIYATKVDQRLRDGNIAEAWDASDKTKIWCIASTVIFIVWAVLLAVALVVIFGLGVSLSFL